MWIERSVDTDSTGTERELICELWSIYPPRPPWWLWLLTALGVGMIVYDFRRMSRRRVSPGVGSINDAVPPPVAGASGSS